MFIKFALIMLLIACALYDLIEFKIPNVLTAGIVLLFPIWVTAQRLPLAQIGAHVVVGCIVFVVAAILFRLRLIGGGDVKLIAGTCLWAGPDLFLAHIVITSFLAVGLLLVISLARRVYPLVTTSLLCVGTMPVPPLLQRGRGIPYGLAISASAVLLGMPRLG